MEQKDGADDGRSRLGSGGGKEGMMDGIRQGRPYMYMETTLTKRKPSLPRY